MAWGGAGCGVVARRNPAGRLLQGDEGDEHRGAAPHPRSGQQVRVVDGPFTGCDGTMVHDADGLRLVPVVVLVFGRETVICLDVSPLSAAGRSALLPGAGAAFVERHEHEHVATRGDVPISSSFLSTRRVAGSGAGSGPRLRRRAGNRWSA